MTRDDAIRSALKQARDNEDVTADGKPTVDAVNHLLERDGHEAISASDRDDAWEAMQEGEGTRIEGGNDTPAGGDDTPGGSAGVPQPDGQDKLIRDQSMPPEEASRIEATAAANAGPDVDALEDVDGETERAIVTGHGADPIPLFINGKGYGTIKQGEEVELSAEAIEALRNAGATVEVIE